MKLDYDLIRDILLVVEEKTDGLHVSDYFSMLKEIIQPGTDNIIKYHLKFLCDARYIECKDKDCRKIIDITPVGREYLDSIRNQDVWDETKKKAALFGEITFDVIKAIATNLVLGALNLK